MISYFALVHKEPRSAFGISFPDLPGCFSAADEEQDIWQQAETALALYAREAGDLPRPRRSSELYADPDVRVELEAGAFLISVPLILVERKERYNVMLEPSLVEGVDRAATVAGVSRSELVSHALREYLRQVAGAAVVKPRPTERKRKPRKAA